VVRRPVRASGRLCAWQTTCGRVPARCARVRPLVRSSVRLCDNPESLCGRPGNLCARPTTCAGVRAFCAAGRRLVRVADNLCERQMTCAQVWHGNWTGVPFGSALQRGGEPTRGGISNPPARLPVLSVRSQLRESAMRVPSNCIPPSDLSPLHLEVRASQPTLCRSPFRISDENLI
jgi:hypothetical protein